MVVRKLSVFLLVIAFHAVVLGVVYLATRSSEPEKPDNPPKNEVAKDTPQDGGASKEGPTKESPKPKPQPIDETPKYDYVFHTVAKGDFLGKIATKYKVSSKDIMKMNNLKDPNKIFLGQKLKIPVQN